VVGIDLAREMLEIARERANELGLKNIEFLEMDAESLSLERPFDAILCSLGLMFFPNLQKALEGIWRLLVPGGWFAAAVQGPPERFQLSGLAMGVARRVLQLPPPEPGMPGPSSLADPALLEQGLKEAGFTEVSVERLMLTFEFPSAEDYLRFNRAVSAPMRAMLAEHSPERQTEVFQGVVEAARKFAGSDGTVRLAGEVNVAAGRRAS
jgi:SAM-dependent methyltransferase